MSENKIDELIKRFDRTNGNLNYSERDLLKYIVSRMDDIDDKVDVTNGKLDNHVTHISQRLTIIETCISNFKWIFGIISVAIISIIVKISV